jgi:cytochrome c5
MNKGIVYLGVVAALLLVACLAVACGGGAEPTQPAPTTTAPTQPAPTTAAPTAAPSVNGGTLLNERCIQCHSLDRVKQATKTLAEWETTVTRMRGSGATLADAEAQILVQYLAQTYGK